MQDAIATTKFFVYLIQVCVIVYYASEDIDDFYCSTTIPIVFLTLPREMNLKEKRQFLFSLYFLIMAHRQRRI